MTSRSCWRGCSTRNRSSFSRLDSILDGCWKANKSGWEANKGCAKPSHCLLSWFPSPGGVWLIVFCRLADDPQKLPRRFSFSHSSTDSIFFSEVSINPESNRICFPSTLSCTWLISNFQSDPFWWFPTNVLATPLRSLTLWRHTVLRSFSCARGTLYSRNYNNTRLWNSETAELQLLVEGWVFRCVDSKHWDIFCLWLFKDVYTSIEFWKSCTYVQWQALASGAVDSWTDPISSRAAGTSTLAGTCTSAPSRADLWKISNLVILWIPCRSRFWRWQVSSEVSASKRATSKAGEPCGHSTSARVLVWEGEIRQVTHPVIGPDICIPQICHHCHHPVLWPGFWRLFFFGFPSSPYLDFGATQMGVSKMSWYLGVRSEMAADWYPTFEPSITLVVQFFLWPFPPSCFQKSPRWFEGVPTIFGNDIQKPSNIKGFEDMLCFFVLDHRVALATGHWTLGLHPQVSSTYRYL